MIRAAALQAAVNLDPDVLLADAKKWLVVIVGLVILVCIIGLLRSHGDGNIKGALSVALVVLIGISLFAVAKDPQGWGNALSSIVSGGR